MSLSGRESGGDRDLETVATPEGDGEFAPDAPLAAEAVESSVAGLETPRGGAPADYVADEPAEEHKPSLMEKVIDEISHGTLLP